MRTPILTLFLLFSFRLFSQPCSVSVSPAQATICSGTSVTLVASGPGPTTSWSWSPAAGLNVTNAATVIASPTVTTSYIVTRHCNGGGTATDTVVVTVNPSPTANASPSVSICNGQSASLGATPAGSGGTSPLTYHWLPGGSVNQHPNVSPSGTTTYTLTVTDANNCSDTDQVTVYVNPNPVAGFTFSPNNICSNLPVNFNNTSTGSNLSYLWNFGDGNTSTLQNPAHIYNIIGNNTGITFQVKLVVTTAFGCTDSVTHTVTVNQVPSTAMAGTGFNGTNLFKICTASGSGNFTFNNASTTTATNTNYTIVFGGGAPATYTNSTFTSVSHTYTTGTYTLLFIVTGMNGCTDTGIYTVFVGSNPAVGLGNPGNTQGCAPITFTFPVTNTINNPPGTTYTVTFSDGSPTQTFSVAPASLTHTFSISSCGYTTIGGIPNAFYVRIVATNPCGTSAATVEPIYVATPPVANFTVSPSSQGCIGIPMTVINSSQNGTDPASGNCGTTPPLYWTISPATGYTIGGFAGSSNGSTDPSLWSSGNSSITLNFTTAGTYTICLHIGNICVVDSMCQTVCVNTPLSPAFTLTPATGCAPLNVTTNNTTPSLACGVNTYNWTVGYTPNPPCGTTSNYSFTGGTSASSVSPSFVFTNAGTYTVTLNVTNPCGTYAISQNVVVKKPPVVTVSTVPSNACSNPASTVPSVSATNCGANALTYSWTFAGGTPATSGVQSPGSISFNGTGAHAISVSVTNECGTTNASTSFTINNGPTANAGVNASICSGQSIVLNGSGSGGTPGYSYSWVSSPAGFSSNAQNPTVSPVVNTTYTVTVMDANGCTGTASVTITINPTPAITNNPLTQTICSGTASAAVAWSSSTGGTTYNWSGLSLNGITGYTANGSGNLPSMVLTNLNSTQGSVVYTVTPTANGCPGTPVSYTILVNPTPVITTAPLAQTICSATSSAVVAWSANVAGTTYSWNGSTANGITGFTASGNGNLPAMVLSNPNNTPGSVVYTVTPSANGCNGSPVTYTITVNPVPNVNALTPQTICSGTSTSPVALSSNVAGTTFNYTAAGTAGISGFTASANGVSSIAAQTLFNSGNAPGTVTYTITPVANGCSGAPVLYTVTVNPAPIVNFSLANQSLCSGDLSQAVTLSTTTPGATITWTSSANGAGGVAAGGTTTIPAQTLTNNTNAAIVVTYTATATTSGGTACPGVPAIYTITVNPVPTITATPNAQTICSGTSTGIALSSNVAGTTFSWTISNNPNISGASGASGNNIAQTLVNSSNTTQNITYTITPTFTNGSACPGSPILVTITVNPSAAVTFLPVSPQTLCSGQNSALVTLSSTVAGVTFGWTSASNGAGGVTAGGTNTIPVQTLTNATNSPITVVYTANATFAGCPGPNALYNIIVNPIPNTILPAGQTICSGSSSTLVNLSSAVAGTTFNWTAAATAGISGFTASANNTLSIPIQILLNAGSTMGSVTYTITPVANGCSGSPATYTIQVNPLPTVILPPLQVICSGQSSALVVLNSPVAGTSFSWTAAGTAGLSGFTASGSGNIPAQVILNPNTTPGTVTFTITPTTPGTSPVCTGNIAIYTITVNPAPSVQFSQGNQTICSGSNTSLVTLTSTTPGASISWHGFVPAGISGAVSSGTTTIPVQTLLNSTNAPLTISDTALAATVGGASCPGVAQIYYITVNPIPVVTATPASQTICSGGPTAIALSSNVAGTTFSWTISNNPNISGASAGSGSNIAQILLNASNLVQTITYTITPTYTNNAVSCQGNPVSVTITVNPAPTVTFTPASPQTVCSQGTSLPIALTSNTPGAGFSWTSVSGGVGGVAASGTNSIPAQTLLNGTANPITVVYTAFASFGGCTGPAAIYNIVVNPLPVVSFSSPALGCLNAPVSLSNTGSGGAGYAWNFGDGTTSTQQNPAHTYTAIGTYTIHLVVTTGAGCVDSITHSIQIVQPPSVSFSMNSTPASHCPPVITTFTNNSSGFSILSQHWDFGNGNSFNGANPPAQTFPQGTLGDTTYYIVLSDSNLCGVITYTDSVLVHPIPIANFGCSIVGCSPFHNTFLNVTTGNALNYSWNFGDGSTLNTTSAASFNHTFTTGLNDTTYLITLTASNACGTDTAAHAITVHPNQITVIANASPLQGCAPLTVNFNATQFGASVIGWNFGNGTFSNNLNASTIYNTPGTYQAYFYAGNTGNGGCSQDTIPFMIQVGGPPVITFTALPNPVCAGTAVAFTNTSAGLSNVNWHFGDGSSSNLVNPNHTYNTAGIYNATMVGTTLTFGCTDSVTNPITVLAVPAITNNPLTQTICGNTNSTAVNWTSNIAGTTYSWSGVSGNGITGFTANGNGNLPAMNLQNPGTTQGSVVYTVTPTAPNGCTGAPVTYTILVNPVPSVNLPAVQSICSGGTSTAVNLTSSVAGTIFNWTGSGSSGSISGFSGSGSGNIPPQTISNSSANPGSVTYTITPVAAGCSGAPINYVITVNPLPAVQFSMPAQTICSGTQNTAVFLNSGTPGATFSWSANIPAGVSGANASGTNSIPAQSLGNSTTGPLTITYTANASFSGCTGPNAVYQITVNPLPVVSATPSSQTICSNTSTNISLSANIAGSTFTWTVNAPGSVSGAGNGSGTTITQTLINNSPTTQTVTYSVIPTYTNNGVSCSGNPLNISITVNPAPVVQFSLANQTLCSGQSTQLVNLSSTTPGATFSWTSVSNGLTGVTAAGTNNIGIQTLTDTTNLQQTASYTATATFAGCAGPTATYTVTVNVTPHNLVTVSPTFGCAPLAVVFHDSTTNANFYHWDFGDGNSSALLSPLHVYQNSGPANITFHITLIASTNFACADTSTFQVLVSPQPVADFSMNPANSCHYPVTVLLSNASQGASGFSWNFGNGLSSALNAPQTQFDTVGVYPVQLIAINSFNCTDTVIHNFIVYPQPVAGFYAVPDSGCMPLEVQFHDASSSNVFSLWNFGDNDTSGHHYLDPLHLYQQAGTYTVTLEVEGLNRVCKDSLTLPNYITVYPKPTAAFTWVNVNSAAPDARVVFFNSSMLGNTYNWTFGDGDSSEEANPTHFYHDLGQFNVQLIAITSHGCLDTTREQVQVDFNHGLFVPNAFTPLNGNDEVRVFKPKGLGLEFYHIQIFDTWGTLLWESTELDEKGAPKDGWDGRKPGSNELLPQDVYVWKIEATFQDQSIWPGNTYDGKHFSKTGSVTLLR